MFALTALGGVAHAAGFDEKLKAPMMKSSAQAFAQAKEFGTRYREISATTPSQVITNASLAREKFDLRWQVERAIDQRKPIEEFGELGFESLGNGIYRVDLNAHAEWDDLASGFVGILSSPDLEWLIQGLMQLGFRPEDITTLKHYVATHDAKIASKSAALPIALGFARIVRKFDKAQRPVPDELVLSHVYQTARAVDESNRLWVAELLKQFDSQRARILLSAFQQLPTTGTWSPTDPALVIADQLSTVRLPNYEEMAIAETQGVAP